MSAQKENREMRHLTHVTFFILRILEDYGTSTPDEETLPDVQLVESTISLELRGLWLWLQRNATRPIGFAQR